MWCASSWTTQNSDHLGDYSSNSWANLGIPPAGFCLNQLLSNRAFHLSRLGPSFVKIWTCESSLRSGSRNAWTRINNVNGASLLSIVEVSRSHSNTPRCIGLFRASYRPVAEVSTRQHPQEKYIYAPSGIRTRNISKRAAASLRCRPRGQRDRLMLI
jgi:hypothetical protein